MPLVKLDSSFYPNTKNREDLQISATTVLQLISELGKIFPDFTSSILDKGLQLKSFIIIYVDGKDIRSTEGLNTMLKSASLVTFKKVLSGG